MAMPSLREEKSLAEEEVSEARASFVVFPRMFLLHL
jgi:hypothetical protein